MGTVSKFSDFKAISEELGSNDKDLSQWRPQGIDKCRKCEMTQVMKNV